ncbi:plasmid partitioning protein RepB C-terminal domain-containing protein [Altererythrobacter sp. Root672]|uniref:plasmid partitioning protein RepB C-terminal domain-containing protein n=1 Tax=Altererythrobacter sp. Root672 TaxID=1736584 RepID=UPI0006FA9543|nr:plasmid partitioning protein RepB C-terminal domain-containing protein [Altererythrobacter sp. Root672]KRA82541.1 chromosome partitioning protein ParB [Altererythrobacter sp. Root672]
MTGKVKRPVARAFEEATLRIPLDQIRPLRPFNSTVRNTVKYRQIAASIREVGLIEPPVVVRDPSVEGHFRLLDGHLRLDVLIAQQESDVVCLVATEDEGFSYNRRISRIATIQEHRMILEAINRGVSEERLARALDVNIQSIRTKRNLLSGICDEAVELLKDKHVAINAFKQLRVLKPMRQIAAAEMMVAMNQYSLGYVKSIVAATPPDQLIESTKKPRLGLTPDQVDLMTEEAARLDRQFKQIEQNYGEDHLDLMLASAYVSSLLENARIVRHLAKHHAQLLSEFQRIAELQKVA